MKNLVKQREYLREEVFHFRKTRYYLIFVFKNAGGLDPSDVGVFFPQSDAAQK